jgi:dihydrofolate synthase/folylpolyglutamate synthase
MMIAASLDEAVQVLSRYIPRGPVTGDYDLSRVRLFLAGLGNPQDRHRVIHIAGTSGKTSTAYYIRGLLEHLGLRTALTVSPHLERLTDRFQVGGEPAGDAEFLAAFDSFMALADAAPAPLTNFEILISFAFWFFAPLDLDYVVAETGLGGRLDATNTISRPDKICVITDIGLDHTEILGDTVEQIAAEKAGIIQAGNAVFCQDLEPAVLAVIEGRCQQMGASLSAAVAASSPVPLARFQQRNWNLATSVVRSIAGRSAAVPGGFPAPDAPSMRPPGRLETFELGRQTVILDGAHNPQKLAALVAAIRARGLSDAVVVCSFSRAPEAKLAASLASLLPITSRLILAPLAARHDMAKETAPVAGLAELARRLAFPAVEVAADPGTGLQRALEAGGPLVVVTGSLYLVAQVRPLLLACLP